MIGEIENEINLERESGYHPASRSRLFRAALSLFERLNRKDEAALWDYIVAGKDLPKEPAGDRVRIWAWKRWHVDLGEGYATVPPISGNV